MKKYLAMLLLGTASAVVRTNLQTYLDEYQTFKQSNSYEILKPEDMIEVNHTLLDNMKEADKKYDEAL